MRSGKPLMICFFLVFVGLFVVMGRAFASNYYCVQIAAVVKKSSERNIINIAKKIIDLYPEVRVERYERYYVLRVGYFKGRKDAIAELNVVRKRFPDAFIKECLYNPNNWIFPVKSSVYEKRKKLINNRKVVDSALCPSSACGGKIGKPIKELNDPGKEFERIAQSFNKKSGKSALEQGNAVGLSSYKSGNSASSKRFLLDKYIFADGYTVKGLDPEMLCRRNGSEIIGRAGLRFAWQITKSISAWGDIFGGLGYQSFMRTNRRRGWVDVRYLYLSTKSIYEPNYYGYYASLGRVPVLERRGFWFHNYLDGAKLGYKSTLLNWFVFAGKRLEDARISNSEERINIQGYDYIIGRADYQYYYRQHLGLFYVLEHKGKFSNFDGASVWKGVRSKEFLNWLGFRLKGALPVSLPHVQYWLDAGYMWGKRGSVNTVFKGCSAYKKVLSKSYVSVKGVGFDLGGKAIFGNEGIGLRIALGEGSGKVNGSRAFYLPRISTNRERLFGLNGVRYYGELTNPDLNNIVILSLFGGYKLYTDNWIELNMLKYVQYKKSGETPFGRYFISPNGRSRDLGYEMDLMFDGRIKTSNDKWRYLITGSLFVPGNAFDGLLDKKNAYGVFMKIKRYW